jgi:RNA polymerase sigma-70 factor (ECF subfamily)
MQWNQGLNAVHTTTLAATPRPSIAPPNALIVKMIRHGANVRTRLQPHRGLTGLARRKAGLSETDATLKSLMLLGLSGNAAAHAQLLARMGGYLRRYFARKLGSSDADLEDLVQDTLLAIHLKRETWDRTLPFSSWAYAIAHHKLIDLYRRRRIRKAEPIETAEALFVTGEASTPDSRLDVDRLLSQLPERQRAVLASVKLEGLSTAEAAQRSGMSESAVKVSVHRALKTLMKRVSDEN